MIFSLDFQRFTDYEDRREMEPYIDYIMEGVEALQNAGADFIAMSANSPHSVAGEIKARAAVPLLSIVDVTMQAATRAKLKRLLLLGIRYTMQSTFYQAAGQAAGIEVIVPGEDEQDEINRIVFEELSRHEIKAESRATLQAIIGRHPADGVILGCTELPLILRPVDARLPLLDTVDLHTTAILDYALS